MGVKNFIFNVVPTDGKDGAEGRESGDSGVSVVLIREEKE